MWKLVITSQVLLTLKSRARYSALSVHLLSRSRNKTTRFLQGLAFLTAFLLTARVPFSQPQGCLIAAAPTVSYARFSRSSCAATATHMGGHPTGLHGFSRSKNTVVNLMRSAYVRSSRELIGGQPAVPASISVTSVIVEFSERLVAWSCTRLEVRPSAHPANLFPGVPQAYPSAPTR